MKRSTRSRTFNALKEVTSLFGALVTTSTSLIVAHPRDDAGDAQQWTGGQGRCRSQNFNHNSSLSPDMVAATAFFGFEVHAIIGTRRGEDAPRARHVAILGRWRAWMIVASLFRNG
jgi:hypothetical protein